MRPMPLLLGAALLACAATTLEAQKPRRAPPVLVTPPAAPAPSSAPADTGRGKARRPSPTLMNGARRDSGASRAAPAPGSAVATQATGNAAAAVTGNTAGLAIAPYEGESDADLHRYLRRFTTQLDSATASLVSVFRNTSGQPLAGAEAPTALSARERERWGRCRDLHFDLRTYADAMHDLVESLPEAPAVQRAGQALDSALTGLTATAECDNVASMIAAPARWTPWASQYTATARSFYHDWYGQVREVSDRNRALVAALNVVLPAAARIPVPPALPRTPPYAGAGPR